MIRALIAAALIALPAPALAQDAGLAAWWRQSFGYTMPATVRPEPYSVELASRGIGCQTAARQPEWAEAEALGRRIIALAPERGFPGQSLGTWEEDRVTAYNDARLRFLACQIANRGVAPDTAFHVFHGTRSFPNVTLRLIAGLAPANGDTERARAEGAAAMKARALSAIGGL